MATTRHRKIRSMSDLVPADWCAADDCPAAICNGPHVEHRCGDHIVTARFDNAAPCPYCGEPLNAAEDRP